MPPQWYKINSTQAEEMFREAIGGLTIQVEQGAINQAIIQSVSNDPDLAPELPTIVKSMSYTTLSALGTFTFVYPYERYKKIISRYPDQHLDVSEAFGLDTFSDRETFLRAFPSTVIHEWGYDAQHDRPSCFADCIRNSFAHAQSTYVQSAQTSVVQFSNTRDGVSVNFWIEMLPRHFWRLVQMALQQFVVNVVDPPQYPPLEKLLTKLTA